MRKFGALEQTEATDSATGGKVRVSTTARLRFREMFPQFADERNVRLNSRIADLFSKGEPIHYFKLGKKDEDEGALPQELAEIRSAGNFFYISAIRGGYVDILTLQTGWKTPASGKGRKTMPKGPSGSEGFSLASLNIDMKKNANIQAVWPQIYTMLKSPPQGINLGAFPSKLPPMEKFKLENVPNVENPAAAGFVTTEDVDDDGNLDTIHISSERFMQELERQGIGRDEIMQLNQLPADRLAGLLSAFVEVISHEMGHLSDYRHGEDEPFPGGEGVAEQAGQQALQQISVATNKSTLNRNRRQNMSALRILAELANKLDSLGATKAADEVTNMMKKKARWPFDKEEEPVSPTKPAMPKPMEGAEEALEKARMEDVGVPLSERGIEVQAPERIETTPPAPIEPASPRIVGELGSIVRSGDPYSYEYIPEREAFLVKSYSYKEGEPANPRAERAVGAYITRENKAAWDLLAKHALPSRSLAPSEGRALLDESTGDPQTDWSEAQLQFAGWVNAGYFGNDIYNHMANAQPDSPMALLYNAELPAAQAKDMPGFFESLIEHSDVKEPEALRRLGEELVQWAAPLAEREPAVTEVSPAEDFALASMDSLDKMQKKASSNVSKLESLFNLPGAKGPFGRD